MDSPDTTAVFRCDNPTKGIVDQSATIKEFKQVTIDEDQSADGDDLEEFPESSLREIYCDLNARMTENGYSLERQGSVDDLAKLGLTLESAVGQHFRFVSDDEDFEGNPDDIMFDGAVVRDTQYGILAVANDRGVFHRSDLKKTS